MNEINLEEERKFENRKAKGEKIREKQNKYYWATQLPINRHNFMTFQKIKGKKVLEIGCSTGRDAKNFVNYCFSYCGVDISDEAIKIAKSLNLQNSEFLCSDGHKIPKNDKEFDCVIVNSLLHHLDLLKSFQEIHRILKPNGILIFREPLGTNPFFQLYRKLTPNARTISEKPFSINDIRIMKKFFILKDVQWYGFFNIISAFLKLSFLRSFLTYIDDLIGKTFLKYLFWQFSGFAEKK